LTSVYGQNSMMIVQ